MSIATRLFASRFARWWISLVGLGMVMTCPCCNLPLCASGAAGAGILSAIVALGMNGLSRVWQREPQKPMTTTDTRLPIVLVAGFLGSGKTTLMRYLIRDAAKRGLRVQVVVNEFGVADVDSNILREADAELLGSIAGGCACCSGAEELLFTLLEAGQNHRDLPRSERADVLLLEASGLADPISMLDTLTAAAILPLVRVGALVSVVDACRLPEMTKRGAQIAPLLMRQAQLADWIVLNKTDLAFSSRNRLAQNEASQKQLCELNPRAHIEPTRRAIIETEAFWKLVFQDGGATRASSNNEFSAADAAHAHYQTVEVPLRGPISRAILEDKLRQLKPNVWRAKGFLRLEDDELHLLQYVGAAMIGVGESAGAWEITPFELPQRFNAPKTSLVFIGPSLDRAQLMRDFGGREVVTLL